MSKILPELPSSGELSHSKENFEREMAELLTKIKTEMDADEQMDVLNEIVRTLAVYAKVGTPKQQDQLFELFIDYKNRLAHDYTAIPSWAAAKYWDVIKQLVLYENIIAFGERRGRAWQGENKDK